MEKPTDHRRRLRISNLESPLRLVKVASSLSIKQSTQNLRITHQMAATIDMEKQPLLDPETQQQQLSSTGEPESELSLSELQQNVFKAQRAYMRAWSRTTSGKLHKRIMYSVTALVTLFMIFGMLAIGYGFITEDDDDIWTKPSRIPLEAHIMSKCPDARDCLHDLILPAMQLVSHRVDFKLSYIGT